MKVKLPHPFIRYAKQFTVESIIEEVSKISFEIFNNPDKLMNSFAGRRNYSVNINGNIIEDEVLIVQTWLIDLVYNVSTLNYMGKIPITRNEALRLIHLHNDYQDKRDGLRIKTHDDALMNLYGFFGEQKRFEEFDFINEYSREEYLMEKFSVIEHPKNKSEINFCEEFFSITGYSPKTFSAILFLIYGYFSSYAPFCGINSLKCDFKNPALSCDNVQKIIEFYSCTIEELRNSKLKRQFLYAKPIIKISNKYVSPNPYLLLCLFTNSNYWIMRNNYMNAKKDKQKFVNAFGKYFEIYLEEVLSNCLNADDFYNIPECDEKRADWHLKIGGYDFLIEQKSTLSILGIKQSEPDVEKMKEYIISTWGEAFEQLNSTENSLCLTHPIKIILLYEDYFLCESLDLLFELRPDLREKYDNRYWLVTIKELEMLLYTYKNNPITFLKIIEAKDNAELTSSKDGRTISQFLHRFGIKENLYLKEFGISNQFDEIKDIIKEK